MNSTQENEDKISAIKNRQCTLGLVRCYAAGREILMACIYFAGFGSTLGAGGVTCSADIPEERVP